MADIGINLAFTKGLPAEHFRYYGKAMPASYAMAWCMIATGFSRIFTKEDLREFLFRIPISLHSRGLVETWLEKERLMGYKVNGIETCEREGISLE